MSRFRRLKLWFKKTLGLHTHDRELFCVGNIAFVKCMDPKCGMESLPWEVSDAAAKAWAETNGHKLEKLYALERIRRGEPPPACQSDIGGAHGAT